MAKESSKVCAGEHRYFVAETVGIEAEGKVVVIALCTACGAPITHAVRVTSQPGTLLKLGKSESDKNKEIGE
jgi:hypothetical protein